MKCTTRGRWTRHARARLSRSCAYRPRARRQPSVIRGGVRGAAVRRVADGACQVYAIYEPEGRCGRNASSAAMRVAKPAGARALS